MPRAFKRALARRRRRSVPPTMTKDGAHSDEIGDNGVMSGSDETAGRGASYARGQRRRFARAQVHAARIAAEALRMAQAAAAAADALQAPGRDADLHAPRSGDSGPRLFEPGGAVRGANGRTVDASVRGGGGTLIRLPNRRGLDGARSGLQDRQSRKSSRTDGPSRGQAASDVVQGPNASLRARDPAGSEARVPQWPRFAAAVAASGGVRDHARHAGLLVSERASAQTEHAIGSGPAPPSIAYPFASVIQGARGTLIGSVGGLSSGQLTMAVAALELAGPSFLPDDSRLKVMRDCSAGCGNVVGLDSTMLGSVSMLQGGGSVSQAARFLLQSLLAHACDGGCRPAPRLPPPPVGSPPNRLAPSRRPRPPQLNDSPSTTPAPISSPTKRHRGEGYPRPELQRTAERADASGEHTWPNASASEGPWLFPRNAERRVELSSGDAQSVRGRSSLSQRVVDGVFFWFLSRAVTSRSRGGARVLSSMTADAFAGAAAGKSWGVRRGSKAIRDGTVLSGGMTVMPVRSGNVWWGVVLRDLDQVLPVLVRYMRRETDAAEVLNSANGAMVVIDTSGVGEGDGGWN